MNIVKPQITNFTLIKNIHDFLQNGEKQIKYSPNKDIVLLLGNTGSGKSTLTQYISGNADKLLSQEEGEDTGNFVIVDKVNKISSTSTIVSQTIYPDLVEDATTKTLYYDCPGFSDTRSAAHEIAATYFIKKVIDSARSVKMIFVVSHNSVSKGADRQDFLLMLQHATDFIKGIEKFKNSIALVVTKIENRYVRGKMASDENVINNIGQFLNDAKQDIEKNPWMITSSDKSSDNKQKVFSLLDIFQNKGENGKYKRIGIFRKPDEAGIISDIPLLREGKISLDNMINKNMKFVEVGEKDFGYTVSAKSKDHISGLTEEINKTILKELFKLEKEVEEYCIADEEKISDLDDFISRFYKLKESFSRIQNDAVKDNITPEMFITEIDKNIKDFNITIPDHYIKTARREGDYINFLNLVSNQSIKNYKSSILAAGLSELTEYLSDSHSFYISLNKMYQRLSEFDIQKNRSHYNTKHIEELKDLFQPPIFNEIHNRIKEMKLDDPKMKLLNRVLYETLKYQIQVTSPEIDKIVVKGINVKLSDLNELLNSQDVKILEVYALHKVFIDTSLDLTGREIQMAIVAPVWEVIGTRSIILDGKPGMDYYPSKARNGETYGENGSDGQSGEPGGPAGNFIGIGKQYINEENLKISANGGKGGRGQDGGNGAEGYDGAHCKSCKPESKVLITVFYNKGDATYKGQNGGNGGNGGIGGYGGHKGFIYTIEVGTESRVLQAEQTAVDGYPGENGKGGSGGRGGRYFTLKLRNYVLLIQQETFEPIDKWADNGQSGRDGVETQKRKKTWKLAKLININNIKTKYRDYLQNNINNYLQPTLLMTFLTEIENNLRFSSQLIINRKKRSIQKAEKLRNISSQKHDQYVMNIYNKYVDNDEHNYLHLYDHHSNRTGINRTVPSNLFLATESSLKMIFPKPVESENMKTEKHININDQYSPMNIYGNLLLSEMVLKKLIGKEFQSNKVYKHTSRKGISSAHDLAYKHYRSKN